MNTAVQSEGDSMPREGKVLNLICVLAALAFVGLAVLNFLSEGSFLSTDSLFMFAVCATLALLFLSVPALDMMSRGVIRLPSRRRKGEATSTPGGSPPITDAKGRPMPPDVRRMMSDMSVKPKP
ncbi:MAG TPA: hypothetical protein VGJ55_10095 [Pyrinomonadaceae bacterium]|jgi:hypothetical protein